MKDYIKRIGIALSVLLNVLLGGYSNQAFSARNYDWKKRGKLNLVWLIDLVADKCFGDKDHCMHSWVYWYTRKNVFDKLNVKTVEQMKIKIYEGLNEE